MISWPQEPPEGRKRPAAHIMLGSLLLMPPPPPPPSNVSISAESWAGRNCPKQPMGPFPTSPRPGEAGTIGKGQCEVDALGGPCGDGK